MEADYSIDLGPDSPALELPWHDPDGRWRYVPLRGDECGQIDSIPLDSIPEAQRLPALRRFLQAANSPESPWQSVKCGIWLETASEGEKLFGEPCEHGSYVDVVLAKAHSRLRANLPAHEAWSRQMAEMLEEEGEEESSAAEIVVRRCYFHREGEPEESDAGYCLSLFVFGYGPDGEAALRRWERTLDLAAACLLRLHPGDGNA